MSKMDVGQKLFEVKQQLRNIKGNAEQISRRIEFLEGTDSKDSTDWTQIFGLLTEIRKGHEFLKEALKEIADSIV
jgi:hypothetical protein